MKVSNYFFLDFDSTITTKDVCDSIMNEYSQNFFQIVGNRYLNKEISHDLLNKLFIESLNVDPTQLIKFLNNNIVLYPGFREFVNHCYKNNIKIFIISSGWDFYIKAILKEYNLSFNNILNGSLETIGVISNNIEYDYKTSKWNIKFTQIDEKNYHSPNKGEVIKKIIEDSKNKVKIYIAGDGKNDISMIEYADRVYAIKDLVRYCIDNNISHIAYSSFYDIINSL